MQAVHVLPQLSGWGPIGVGGLCQESPGTELQRSGEERGEFICGEDSLTCTRTYMHIFVMTKPAVFPRQFILVDNQLDQFQGLILSRRGRGVSLFGMRLLHSPEPISSHLLIYSSLFYVDTFQYFLPNRKEFSCVAGLSKTL